MAFIVSPPSRPAYLIDPPEAVDPAAPDLYPVPVDP